MIKLSPDEVVRMAPAKLAERVLYDMIETKTWSVWNYINEAQQGGYRGDPAQAISGALGWLQGQGLIAHDPHNGSTWSAMVVTPAGRRFAAGE